MSSFPTGGSRAFVKSSSSSSSPATSARSTHSTTSSSPPSTLSESGGHRLAISAKGARAPRKRPNQAYDEAAALLATAYPGVFPAKGLPKLLEKKNVSPFHAECSAEHLPLFPALGDAGFLLHGCVPHEQRLLLEPAGTTRSSSGRSSSCLNPASNGWPEPNSPAGIGDSIDAGAMLDVGEVGEGIDSIMGNLDVNSNSGNEISPWPCLRSPTVYGAHGGCGGNLRLALRRGAGDEEWWRCRTVAVLDIAPELNSAPPPPSANMKKKEMKKKVQKVEKDMQQQRKQRAAASGMTGLGLKLDYEGVLKAWSRRGSSFSDAGYWSETAVGTIERF